VFLPLCISRVHSRYQLSDVANGLCHLHSCNVIHGNLKGVRHRSKSRFTATLTPSQPNILVDDSGHARITDFGLAAVVQNLDSMENDSLPRGPSARWAAPEVLVGGKCSMEADIFSFAMVMIEARRGWSTIRITLAYHHMYQHRYSLVVRFRSVVFHLPRSWYTWYKPNVQCGQHIQPSQRICGN